MRTVLIFLIFLLHNVYTAVINSESVYGAQIVDSEVKDTESETGSVFDTIANVNTEYDALMPPNADRKSYGLFEYDIQLEDRSHAVVFGEDPKKQFGATSNFKQLWPDGKVYYTFHSSIASESPATTAAVINEAMNRYHQKTCIKFIQRNTETHYIEFHKGAGCWSMIGRVGGKQQISIGYGCEQVGVVMHEMMHALGFWHEQSRPDRDQYVQILFNNVKDGKRDQFKIYNRGEIDSRNSPYDYYSLMHYGDRSFSKDPTRLKTILVKDANFRGTLGQRNGFSASDIQQLKILYKCNSGGASGPVDGQWGPFSLWSSCDKPCGGGIQTRSRSCNNPPPSNGGKGCIGNDVERRSCNTNKCEDQNECSFESSFCGWRNLDTSQIKWQRRTGGTPSSDTGPSQAKSSTTGVYIYMEATGPAQGDRAHLTSNIIVASESARCLQFDYHMYGQDIGQLNIYYMSVRTGKASPVWSLSGNQGNQWNTALVPIDQNLGEFQIFFEGVIGGGFKGDIALDDIKITSSPCSIRPPSAAIPIKPPTQPGIVEGFSCNFESANCKWGNVEAQQDSLNWQQATGFTPSDGTGPKDGSTFIYIEASKPAMKDNNAWLASPVIPSVSDSNKLCFQFRYHMFGTAMGSLNIKIYDGELKNVWTISGNQGDQWHAGQVPLPYGTNQRIVIEGVVGPGWSSDIAIDDLQLSNGGCQINPPNAGVTKPTVKPPTKPTIPAGSVLVEVSSEGCFDPPVRQRTLDKLSKQVTRRRRGLGDFFRKIKDKVKEKAKEYSNKLKKTLTSKNARKIQELLKKIFSKKAPKMTKVTEKTKNPEVSTDCSLAQGSIKVNGVEYSLLKPGHNVVVINGETGIVSYRKNYETKNNPSLWSTVNKDLQGVPQNSIIAVAVQGSSIPQYVSKNELRTIGATAPFLPGADGSWAFIGYKGTRAVNWIKQVSNIKGSGPSTVASMIPLMKDSGTTTTGGGGGVTQPKTITTITIQKSETVFNGRTYMQLPLEWSNKLDFGIPEYTISLWFKTIKGGTIFSKALQSLTNYDDSIKVVYIENGKVNVKMSKGSIYTMARNVVDGGWHHLVIVVSEPKLFGYIDESLYLERSIVLTPDDTTAIVNIGRTVDNFPQNNYFQGTMKNMIYKNVATKKEDLNKLST